MRFGRVEGFVETAWQRDQQYLKLKVVLETSSGLRTLRDETVPMLDGGNRDASLCWQADQYTQETIGVDLAQEGWEVIGAGEIPERAPGEVARSASYAVRQL